jgi:hypothetical protein
MARFEAVVSIPSEIPAQCRNGKEPPVGVDDHPEQRPDSWKPLAGEQSRAPKDEPAQEIAFEAALLVVCSFPERLRSEAFLAENGA